MLKNRRGDEGATQDRELERIQFYESFMERFGDTPYSKEVRLELAALLRSYVSHHRNEVNLVDQYEPLLLRYVSDCLADGPAYASVVSRDFMEYLAMRGKWDVIDSVIGSVVAFPKQERGTDSLVVEITRDMSMIPLLQRRLGLPEGEPTERLEARVLQCIERSLEWRGNRRVGFGHDAFELLNRLQRWDLLEQAAERTLLVAQQRVSVRGNAVVRGGAPAEQTAAAEEFLQLARRQLGDTAH